ncbi:hypothetical protein GWO43_18710, partial [candidate division KSB1 bacterium]|nr:hypothetical protein [candidate division KSB1 bacterium]NIR70875.1 hypothetical protein [candidate division KSB1 bacterium]NIS26067.1 hypothetical protein [candidate division KSB1 bacterium]NIT72867.1 hypothetical protein [candidate division KSB1 bacterium]NIU26714.1 hypothetical protein [candidate division KSB1 bacterium]
MIKRSRISNIILALLGAVFGYILSVIDDNLYNYIAQLISYKWMVIIALLIILTLTYFLSTKPAITGTKILNKNLSNAPIIKVFLDLGLKNIHRHLTDDDIRTRLEESLNIQVHKTWFPENDQIEEGLLSAIKNGAAVDLLLCKPDSYILRKRCEAAQEPMGPYWIYRAIKKIHKTITNPENRNINRKITITLYDEWPGCPVI